MSKFASSSERSKVLVIAAHPDDEVLGCGGTIAGHSARGDQVAALFLADGVGSRHNRQAAREVAARKRAATEAANILGIAKLWFLGLPDNQLDGMSLLTIVKSVENFARKVRPDIVYTHFAGDLNVDHRVCHAAVMTACRPVPGSTVKAIYSFEVLSSTEWSLRHVAPSFSPARFNDISAFLSKKMDALRAYGSEMRPFPHARSFETVEALARLRGSAAGLAAAEAFVVEREIVQ